MFAQDKTAAPPLDPQCQTFVDTLAQQAGPSWEEMGVDQARTTFNSFTDLFGTGPAEVSAQDLRLDGRIPVRIYRPLDQPSTAKQPVVMYFHGGGWVLGNLDTHDALCRRLCHQAQCALIAVDYRLSPEHPHPAPLDDCYAATEYVAQHGDELNIDSKHLVVVGDSAGGTLAVSVAIKARNSQGPKIAGQVLIYPVLDSRCNSASYQSFASGYGLTRADMLWFWKQYLGDHKTGVYAVPAKAKSLDGLPPTTIITAGYDVLRDEAEQFAAKLREAGVPVELRRYDSMIHGFVHFAGAFDRGLEATTELSVDLKRHFESIR